MDFNYIIVQAGGKGTRLEHLTKNKPKALVPVNNLPILFHLFKKYPDKKYIIIGDYKCDVLTGYLKAFAEVEYTVVDAEGKSGTCGGMKKALDHIPDRNNFMIIWSDLVLPESYDTSSLDNDNYVCLSGDFECRWSYRNGKFAESRSKEYGVAGMFIFTDKHLLDTVPESGEFVKWLSSLNIPLASTTLYQTNEYGLISVYNKIEKSKCRPFNRVYIEDNRFVKEPITAQGIQLAEREVSWYKKVIDKKFQNLPHIYSFEPLAMEMIKGKNIYDYGNLSFEEKSKIITDIVNCLKEVHSIGSVVSDKKSYDNAYIDKTLQRLEKVKELVPFAKDEYVVINGKKCRNFFYHVDEVKELFDRYFPSKFVFLHGDCTFSNIMMREDMTPVLIDPRGYFGTTELYGDVAYDWAKLYYSIVGNYDQFNLKEFRLSINEHDVTLDIKSSGWEDMEDMFICLIRDEINADQIKLIHAIIWLSLTTYAWEDYDSICGAFYNGLLYLEEIL